MVKIDLKLILEPSTGDKCVKSKKKSAEKLKKSKKRIKAAPPSQRHKSVKDYDRKTVQDKALDELVEYEEKTYPEVRNAEFSDINKNPHSGSSFDSFMTDQCECTPKKGCLDPQESPLFWNEDLPKEPFYTKIKNFLNDLFFFWKKEKP